MRIAPEPFIAEYFTWSHFVGRDPYFIRAYITHFHNIQKKLCTVLSYFKRLGIEIKLKYYIQNNHSIFYENPGMLVKWRC